MNKDRPKAKGVVLGLHKFWAQALRLAKPCFAPAIALRFAFKKRPFLNY